MLDDTVVDAVRMLLLLASRPKSKMEDAAKRLVVLRSGSWCCDVSDTARKVFHDIRNLSNIYKQDDYMAC